ncbi:MAG: insulinase family protein [Bacteroidales bacterium]|nr:insulinase family protein [Bacteroidales bacterium]
MINYKKFTLSNGLTLLVHKDESTPIVAVNILYKVGSRNESPDKTGFAHLFEHLMFGGSVNIPDYDKPLEKAGGENNAFTNSDITNYYITLPKENLETAFWLESDRMLNLAFSEKSLEVQRQVVIEEFKQSYLNQPYGDVWMLLKPLAYKQHSYQWNTIGKEIKHIEDAKMEDVKAFYKKHYNPNNAILVVAGNVEADEILALTKKWFGDIPSGDSLNNELVQEPEQKEARFQEVYRDVPIDALYKVFHMDKRGSKDYYSADLLSDVLSNGNSSRLYRKLIKEEGIFSELDAYITGDFDPGLFVFNGKPAEGISLEEADKRLTKEIELIKSETVSDFELQKVKNKLEASRTFSETSILNNAINLAIAESLGDADTVNLEEEIYNKISVDEIQQIAQKIFQTKNSSTLYYRSNQKNDATK